MTVHEKLQSSPPQLATRAILVEKDRPSMQKNEQSPNPFEDTFAWMVINMFARNNYMRVIATAGMTLGVYVIFPSMTPLFVALTVFSLGRGLWRDISAWRIFVRSPTARELLAVSKKPYWNENRRRLLTFSATVSDRDEVACIPGNPLIFGDPVRAMSEINRFFEYKALTTFGDAVRCYRIRRYYDNYTDKELCPLPSDLPKNTEGLPKSYHSFCFCQKRKEMFFPYLIMVYVHMYAEGNMVHSKIYAHGFLTSTWIGEDNPYLQKSTLPDSIAQLWNEALAHCIEKNPYGSNQRADSTGDSQRTQGRTNR